MRLSRVTTFPPAAVLALTMVVGCGGDPDPDPAAVKSTGAETTAAEPPPVPTGDVPAYCAAYEVISQIDPAAQDPDALKANLIAFGWATVEAADAAPPEIEDAAQLLADRFPEYVATIEAADYRPTKKQVLEFFNADDVTSAAAELDTFAEDNCDS